MAHFASKSSNAGANGAVAGASRGGAGLLSSESVLNTLQLILAGAQLPEILTVIAQLVEAQGEGMLCTVFLLEEDGMHVRCAAAPSLPGFIPHIGSIPVGNKEASCGTAIYRKEPVYVADILVDPLWDEYRHLLKPYGLRAVWARPLLSSDGKVLGTFASYYREPRTPDHKDLQLIENASQIAGIAIERHLREEELRRSEARSAAILNSALDCIVTIDHEGRITEFNPASERTFGYFRKEVLGKHIADVIIPLALRERHKHAFTRYLATEEATMLGQRVEMTALRADGNEFPVELAITRIAWSGPPAFTGYLRDITERKNSEESLRRTAALLAEAQRLSLTGSFRWNVSTDDHFWSAETFRIFEYDAALKIRLQLVLDRIHPSDLHVVEERMSMVATGQDFEYECRFVMPSGAVKHLHVVAHSGRDLAMQLEYIGAVQDVTDRRLAEERLRASELNLRQMTETIPEMLWSATAEGKIDYCNARFLEYTGLLAAEVMGDGWLKVLHPDDVDRTARLWEASVRTGTLYRVEVRTIHGQDQTYRWCVTSALPLLDLDGRILKWHGAVVDMHDWKQAQEELRNTQTELANVTRVMTMGELTASIAHEVNQPLSGIITNASTCLRMLNAEPPNIEGALETTRRTLRDGNRASDVIERLRGLFSKTDFALEDVDLNEAAREVMNLLDNEIQKRAVTLRSEFAESLPTFAGARVQIQQVILNFLLNAFDSMDEVSGIKAIVIRTEQDIDDHVRLSVRDAGKGLGVENLERVFKPFYTTKNGGMGIGLSVSRSIIESHYGRIWAAANDGPGATFSFLIPRQPPSETAAERIGTLRSL